MLWKILLFIINVELCSFSLNSFSIKTKDMINTQLSIHIFCIHIYRLQYRWNEIWTSITPSRCILDTSIRVRFSLILPSFPTISLSESADYCFRIFNESDRYSSYDTWYFLTNDFSGEPCQRVKTESGSDDLLQ